MSLNNKAKISGVLSSLAHDVERTRQYLRTEQLPYELPELGFDLKLALSSLHSGHGDPGLRVKPAAHAHHLLPISRVEGKLIACQSGCYVSNQIKLKVVEQNEQLLDVTAVIFLGDDIDEPPIKQAKVEINIDHSLARNMNNLVDLSEFKVLNPIAYTDDDGEVRFQIQVPISGKGNLDFPIDIHCEVMNKSFILTALTGNVEQEPSLVTLYSQVWDEQLLSMIFTVLDSESKPITNRVLSITIDHDLASNLNGNNFSELLSIGQTELITNESGQVELRIANAKINKGELQLPVTFKFSKNELRKTTLVATGENTLPALLLVADMAGVEERYEGGWSEDDSLNQDQGGLNHKFVMTLDKASPDDYQVNVKIEHQDTDANDFLLLQASYVDSLGQTQWVDIVNGDATITIPASVTVVNIDAQTQEDADMEGHERFKIVIEAVSGVTGLVSAQGIILEDDSLVDLPILSSLKVISEPSTWKEGGYATFELIIDKPTGDVTCAKLFIRHLNTEQNDFTSEITVFNGVGTWLRTLGSVGTQYFSISAGESRMTFNVPFRDDGIVENNEQFELVVQGVEGVRGSLTTGCQILA